MSRLVASLIALTGVSAMAIESPKYEVVEKLGDVELRRYPGYLVAQTEVTASRQEAGNDAFRRLAGYIFGGNKGASKIEMTAPVTQQPAPSEKIAMTAPVTQTSTGEGTWVVRFMMPSSYTLETLPTPNDARVVLKAVAPRTVAVLRYSGTWSEANYQEHLASLETTLREKALTAVGAPTWARYDPPWIPWFMRTNEIQVEIAAELKN